MNCIYYFLPTPSCAVRSIHFFEQLQLRGTSTPLTRLSQAHGCMAQTGVVGLLSIFSLMQHFCLKTDFSTNIIFCQRGGISVKNAAFPSKTSNDWKQHGREQICYALGSCTDAYEAFGGAAVVPEWHSSGQTLAAPACARQRQVSPSSC